MRICFYWFNLSAPPGMSVGVSLLAHELALAGHEVSVVLFNEQVGMPLSQERIEEHARRSGFGLHALSFGQNHYTQAMRVATLLKRAAPESYVLCGGVHTTLNAEQVLRHPEVDFVGLGEVDHLITRFVAALEAGDGYDEIPNFWLKRGAEMVKNPLAPLPDITNQTSLFLEGIDYTPLIRAARGFAETVVGRGCPMRCNYCHNAAIQATYRRLAGDSGTKRSFCRLRGVDNVIAELSEFVARYGDEIRAFNFGDDVFASDPGWLSEFAARYAAEIKRPFICNSIAGRLDRDVARLLADAGCNMVKFGVESGSPRVRREVLNRQLSEPKLRETVGFLRAQGINTRAYVMLGMPTETPEERARTIDLCADLRFDSVRPAIMYPFPGTELHRLCVERDLVDQDRAPTDYSSTTVLKLPRAERVLLEKTALLYPWLLNRALGGEARAAARPLIERVEGLTAEQWFRGEGREIVVGEGLEIHAALNRQMVEHYHAPFPERQDAIFLYRQRPRPLINISSDGWGEG